MRIDSDCAHVISIPIHNQEFHALAKIWLKTQPEVDIISSNNQQTREFNRDKKEKL